MSRRRERENENNLPDVVVDDLEGEETVGNLSASLSQHGARKMKDLFTYYLHRSIQQRRTPRTGDEPTGREGQGHEQLTAQP